MTHDRCQRLSVSVRVLFFLTVCVLMLPAPARAGACETWAAKAVSVQGIVEARPSGAVRWNTVSLDDTLCPGDMVRVKANGRASLVLSNDTILRLDQNTTVTFSVITQDEPSQLDILDGIAHFISRVRQSFKVITPFVNAAVEGTEFVVAVRGNESRITVFEGRVAAGNPQGQVSLASGQSAVARAGQAPVMRAVVRPRDAVQWALYYPPILDYDPERFRGVPAPWQSRLRDSIEAYRRADAAAALNRLAGLPDTLTDARVYTYRASLRLAVGRVEEAKTDLKRALALDSRQSDALALSAIIAVVQNDRAKARSLAEQAVAADPGSAAAKLALSYVQQAEFDIEGALATVQQAIDHQPNNALAWARLAELRLSLGELKQALLTARRATEINPELARTQSVLGFAYLTQIKVKKAKQAFERAIELDQSDPLSRLGLGLATIRQGELKEGRRQIELAASLDPNNALIRSYLGKAYYEEKRDKLAADQLAMAKELDPKDPTPWFYDAIRKQSINRPVEALKDLQKSIELNNNRAVYRSRLLLDEDEAARSASLARIYSDLNFEQRALVEGWKSVNINPGDHSAHRFLADSYLVLPRHKIARVSELLQAQLLQPININPIQPQLAESNLGILDGTGPSQLSFNEFNPLFTRNGAAVQANGITGSNNTWGDDFVIAGILGKTSLSLGQYHYETDGIRDNNDQEQDIYNAFIQTGLSNDTSIQAEWRSKDLENGDLILRFDPNEFFPDDRKTASTDSVRIGFHHAFSSRSDFIANVNMQEYEFESFISDIPDFATEEDGYTVEIQQIYQTPRSKITLGAGNVNFDRKDIFTDPFSFLTFEEESEVRHNNYYLYWQWNIVRELDMTLGASADYFTGGIDDDDELNPKFGLFWTPGPSTTIRAAAFQTFKRTLFSDQTIEPTQVAGFNQFFDDSEATVAWRYGLGIDQEVSTALFAGIEFSERDLEFPIIDPFPIFQIISQDTEEQLGRTYLNWIPHPWWPISLDYQYERVDYKLLKALPENTKALETQYLRLGLGFFHPRGMTVKIDTIYVDQEGEFFDFFNNNINIRDDQFWLVDASIGYRFPRRRGRVSIIAKNIFDKEFMFQDTDRSNPRFLQERQVFLQLNLSFQ